MPVKGVVKSQHLRSLDAELKKAEESLSRWLALGKRLHTTSKKGWRNVANVRRLNIQMLKLLIKSARYSD
jgi:hypothetical protein